MERETDKAHLEKSTYKSEIRRQILSMRDKLEPQTKAQYDKAIREQVFAHPLYQESQIMLAYASYRSEVDTSEMIRQALADGKYVFVPKVSGPEMEFWQITSPADLHRGYKGIPEPAAQVSFPEWRKQAVCRIGSSYQKTQYRAMMWMPGAVFDRKRHRIGYGRGFYDRYLGRLYGEAGERKMLLTTAALAYLCQLVEELPCEAHDVKPDLVITEAGIIS